MKSQNPNGRCAAFTLIELLVVIFILSVLAAMVFPALAGTNPKSKAAQCMNNLRRLTGAWQMYASDNADQIIANPTWVAGFMDWNISPDNTNTMKLIDPIQSPIARYVQAADLFKCPADNYLSPVQRASAFSQRMRSVSLNGALGGNPLINNQIAGRTYFGARRVTELSKPGPANTIAILDEHPDSINDGTFFAMEGLQASNAQWVDLPASYHAGGGGLSFADGHAIMRRWQDIRTVRPVGFITPPSLFVPGSVDYVWVNDRLPYR